MSQLIEFQEDKYDIIIKYFLSSLSPPQTSSIHPSIDPSFLFIFHLQFIILLQNIVELMEYITSDKSRTNL